MAAGLDSGNASATVRISGAALAQLGGTNNGPTGIARPVPTDTVEATGAVETRRPADSAAFSAS